MKILVAGGNGQVGSALRQLGVQQKLDIVALGRTELDITSTASIQSAFKAHQPELLINAAAYTAVDKAESEVELAYKINELGVALLADACAEAEIPMLHISTDYVFDGQKGTAYVETDPVCPLSIYGKSKEAGERALRDRLPEHIILRTSWVFGVHGNNFVKTMLRLAKDRDQLSVVSDQFGGPTSANEIAVTLLAIANQFRVKRDVDWGTYHFSQLPHVSWYEFAKSIFELAKTEGVLDKNITVNPISSSEFPTQAVRPMNSRMGGAKLGTQLGIKPLAWEVSLKKVLQELKLEEK